MILVLGGTSDAVLLAQEIWLQKKDVLLSTATAYGSETIEGRFDGQRIYGKKDKAALSQLIVTRHIEAVVDATHPFAKEISQNAMTACNALNLAYCRYERPEVDDLSENVLWFKDYESAGRAAEMMTGNVFITTGSNQIELLLNQISDWKRLRVRVLPASEAILKLETLGLNADNIIAMKGPFSEEMNYWMLKESNAKIMICKDSGQQGGTENKIKAASRLEIKVLIIRRPEITYIQQFSKTEAVINWLMTQVYGG